MIHKVVTVPNFSIQKSLDSGQCFRYKERNGVWQVISGGRMGLFIQRDPNTLEILAASEADLEYWANYFGLYDDYGELQSLIYGTKHPFLIECYETSKGLRVLHQDPWETLVSFIISQRNNINRIKLTVDKLCKLCGAEREGVMSLPYHAFPTKQELLEGLGERGGELGLGYRLPYLLSLATSDFDIKALCNLSYEEVILKLTSLYGVGPKVANCVALFSLNHTEAFPIDVWIGRIIDKEFRGVFNPQYFGQYAGIVQQYMFYTYRLKHA